MASATGAGPVEPLSAADRVPREVLEHILDLLQPSLADLRAICSLSRIWLQLGRTLLFREVNVCPNTVAVAEREVMLYPRCMSMQSFGWLVNRAPHLLTFTRRLSFTDVQLPYAPMLEAVGRCTRSVRTLCLSDLFLDDVGQLVYLLRAFDALAELRIHNVRAPPLLDPHCASATSLTARADPLAVRFAGRNSSALYLWLARSTGLRALEFSLHRTAFYDRTNVGRALLCLRSHADSLEEISFEPTCNNDISVQAFLPVLQRCTALSTLRITFDCADTMSALSDLFSVPLRTVTVVHVRFSECLEDDRSSYDAFLTAMDSSLAAWNTLREVVFVAPRCCASAVPRLLPGIVEKGMLTLKKY
ncbi:hypothetical protein AURDEDRAFT_186413 [Auricularia subglabra TFB-10046 SS5]|nr:hypothetical protein AURDEDRAFT_186413 [Auricularia subglabra TFB-10046 SS5]